MELHRKQVLDDDTKLVETMLNDVTNGNLRKKARRNHFGAGGGFAISDSDDEAEILRSLKRAGARSALLRKREEKGDEGLTGLERFAVNPKTAAFAKCFAGFEALEEEDEEGGGRRGMMSSSEEECSFAAVRAQLGREMAGKFGRSVGLKKRVSDLSIRSGSVGLGPKTKSSLEDRDEMMNDDGDEEEEVVVGKKRSIVPLTSRYDEDDENVDDVVIESVTKRARHVIDDDSQDLAAKIFVESSPAPSKIEFAAFDVSKLMSKKRDGSTATVKKRVDDNDVQPLKYVSFAGKIHTIIMLVFPDFEIRRRCWSWRDRCGKNCTIIRLHSLKDP
ncbi:hypothetical protein BCR33DRAFT_236599 [Rhizoclosmatium globosum]|uniref:DNA replication checkpoint mediator MRC1 domain-containing protein n=1 Tax=Rhizoclosmatium globosum TaxID=329046 RepID=A0A1Y2CAU0_9FUNG|nr:hypothetical protein BCR33DRAFT_236599 [Rhizoclosmatium globosum]|eukprot:ORY44158.1 hypothetical protein BCR33DRAFT_236599 [Rhizoclosmatium globosum]